MEQADYCHYFVKNLVMIFQGKLDVYNMVRAGSISLKEAKGLEIFARIASLTGASLSCANPVPATVVNALGGFVKMPFHPHRKEKYTRKSQYVLRALGDDEAAISKQICTLGVILYRSMETKIKEKEQGELERQYRLSQVAIEACDRILHFFSQVKDRKCKSHEDLINALITGNSKSKFLKGTIRKDIYTNFLKENMRELQDELKLNARRDSYIESGKKLAEEMPLRLQLSAKSQEQYHTNQLIDILEKYQEMTKAIFPTRKKETNFTKLINLIILKLEDISFQEKTALQHGKISPLDQPGNACHNGFGTRSAALHYSTEEGSSLAALVMDAENSCNQSSNIEKTAFRQDGTFSSPSFTSRSAGSFGKEAVQFSSEEGNNQGTLVITAENPCVQSSKKEKNTFRQDGKFSSPSFISRSADSSGKEAVQFSSEEGNNQGTLNAEAVNPCIQPFKNQDNAQDGEGTHFIPPSISASILNLLEQDWGYGSSEDEIIPALNVAPVNPCIPPSKNQDIAHGGEGTRFLPSSVSPSTHALLEQDWGYGSGEQEMKPELNVEAVHPCIQPSKNQYITHDGEGASSVSSHILPSNNTCCEQDWEYASREQEMTSALNEGAVNPCIQSFEKENVAPDGEGTFPPLSSMLLGPRSSGNRAFQHGNEEPEMPSEVCLLSDLRKKDIVILAKQLDPDHINANWKSVGRKCSLPEEILKSIEDKRPISDTPAYQMLKSLPHIVPGLTIGKVVEKLEGSEMKQRHIAKCIRDSGLDLQLPFCSIGEDWIQKIAYCLMTDSKVIGSWEDLADSFEIPLPDVRLSRKDNALKRENGTHTELLISALIGMNSKMTMEDLARVLDELGRKHVADIVRGMISNWIWYKHKNQSHFGTHLASQKEISAPILCRQ